MKQGKIKSFDVDFAFCDCPGTPDKHTDIPVIPVKWKRVDNDPRGKVRFTCCRCNHKWTLSDVGQKANGIVLDATHPEFIKKMQQQRKRV